MAARSKKRKLRIELTPEQQEQVRQATGRDVSAVKLMPETLEERVAPLGGGGIGPAPGLGPVG